MSILSSTFSGLRAPLTEELALSMGYTIRGYYIESGPVQTFWEPPKRITEHPNFIKGLFLQNPFWSNQNGVFFHKIFIDKTHVIDKLFHLLMLEKYWTAEFDETMSLYATLATGYNPNNIDIKSLTEKYGIQCPF